MDELGGRIFRRSDPWSDARNRGFYSMTEVIITDDFEDWYDSLNEQDSDAVYRVVGLLEKLGPCLGYPHSSAIEGSEYPLRELRVQSGGHPLRILYAFDPKRQAVLLVGGDKTGKDRFYEKTIPKAERLWRKYLADLE
jgi:hypothetical protein